MKKEKKQKVDVKKNLLEACNKTYGLLTTIIQKKSDEKSRKSKYIIAIIANAVLLYAVNNILKWDIDQVTTDFIFCIWIFDVLLIFSIIANTVLFLYDKSGLRQLLSLIISIISFVAIHNLYRIYPFNFSHTIDITAKIIFILTLILIGINMLFELIGLVIQRPKKDS